MHITRVLRAGVLIVVPAVVLVASGCILKTDLVGAAFNSGALDSNSDPFRVPKDLAASRVERIVEQELADGYFRQGGGGEVGAWLTAAATNVDDFVQTVYSLNAPTPSVDAGSTSSSQRAQNGKTQSDANVASWTHQTFTPICKAKGNTDSKALEIFLDDLRFKEALWRAVRRLASIALEGLVSPVDVKTGATMAFTRASTYVQNRKWQRRETGKVAGLAIEGGAASGIFSAGAVWVVLNLMNSFMSECGDADVACKNARDVRFRLISGTSTGAMVAVAVDRFNSMKTRSQRGTEINNIAKWFTCYSFSDLMCVQSKSVTDLFGSMQGVLQFDGIQKVLGSCVKPWMFSNLSELILNTTEFRTGRIFALSDQNELQTRDDVVHASLASALLPVIGDPDKGVHDRVPFDPQYDGGSPQRAEPVFLDGGIRSELPILPLVRRGAERILAVASGASMITEVGRLGNALEIAARYINVNTGSVMETEVEYSKRVAESARQCEIDSCMNALDPHKQGADAPCDKAAGCSRWNVCHGDFAHVCPDVATNEDTKRDEHDKLNLAQRLEPFWEMESIFVDQSTVDGLSGYDFRPSELRRLFRAGAEAARVRCLDIAHLLGILPTASVADVNKWCAVRMDTVVNTCGRTPASTTTFVARACNKDLPDYLDACKNDVDPQ